MNSRKKSRRNSRPASDSARLPKSRSSYTIPKTPRSRTLATQFAQSNKERDDILPLYEVYSAREPSLISLHEISGKLSAHGLWQSIMMGFASLDELAGRCLTPSQAEAVMNHAIAIGSDVGSLLVIPIAGPHLSGRVVHCEKDLPVIKQQTVHLFFGKICRGVSSNHATFERIISVKPKNESVCTLGYDRDLGSFINTIFALWSPESPDPDNPAEMKNFW